MLFNSLNFGIFFILVILIYFSISHKYRWMLLLAASYYFYMAWKPEYIFLIIISTLVDYFAGIRIGNSENPVHRKYYLCVSIGVNISLLLFFKYYNFFSGSLKSVLDAYGLRITLPYSEFLLPVGISFYTFQTLSYTIEVYRKKIKPEYHPGKFALYVSFFPQLVAGPIERASNLLPQIFRKVEFNYDRIASGIRLMAFGLFKKVVIADRLAVLVDIVYNDPASHTGVEYVVATFFFAFQIYCDFSGYSDIAIGAARILGFDLMENFRRPYHAGSIGEFWKRWHISLSTWFRDYVYIPLGGNRVRKSRWLINLIIVFLVSGLWHGANWTFIVWGALHGSYMIVSILTSEIRKRITEFLRLNKYPLLHRSIQIAITFILVNFAWIFFRANSLSDAFHIVQNLFSGWSVILSPKQFLNVVSFGKPLTLVIALLSILILETIHFFERKVDLWNYFASVRPMYRWFAYYALLIFILIFGVFDNTPFIYFQF